MTIGGVAAAPEIENKFSPNREFARWPNVRRDSKVSAHSCELTASSADHSNGGTPTFARSVLCALSSSNAQAASPMYRKTRTATIGTQENTPPR